jgi:hypothetical protein
VKVQFNWCQYKSRGFLVTDNGNELGGGKPQYREVLAEKLLAQGLIGEESQVKHRYTLSLEAINPEWLKLPLPKNYTEAMSRPDAKYWVLE